MLNFLPGQAHRNGASAGYPVGLSLSITDLAAAMDAVASGDADRQRQLDPELCNVVRRLLIGYKHEQASLLRSFAELLGDASETAIFIGWITHDVREVAGSTQAIDDGLGQLASAASKITTGARSCGEQVSQILGGMENASSALQQTRNAIGAVSSQVSGIDQQATELATAVERISEMMRAIEAISRQTDLLALNATIEAARAGERGRGFGVVAAEVKALSSNTAKATEEIRRRITTLSSGMQAIRSATTRSVAAVTQGENLASRAKSEFEMLNSKIEIITSNLGELTEEVSQQQNATREISASVTRINEKASKVRGEVEASLACVTRAEERALQVMREAGRLGISHHELVTISGEAVSWKRRLAATLVGLLSPTPDNEVCASRRLGAWYSQVKDPALKKDIAFRDLQTADEVAHLSAQQMMAFVQRQDWEKATQAYIAADQAIGTMLRSAATLLRTYGETAGRV
jgi:methyl-accepting chemotaxis protein